VILPLRIVPVVPATLAVFNGKDNARLELKNREAQCERVTLLSIAEYIVVHYTAAETGRYSGFA
jgi:hypothetical protein